MDLQTLRRQIDDIDKKIVELLNSRSNVSVKISELKNKDGQAAYSPDRESQVLSRVRSLSKGPLPKDALSAIYREIMSYSLSLGKSLIISYLGPEASFSHLAALKRFGSQVNYLPCNTIQDVFLEIEKGKADFGVVPVENSVEGAVSHTLDMFIDSDLKICAQVILDISHNLLANCGRQQIKRVYSNPQVLAQCRMWLEENLPCVEKIETSSSTRAAQIASRQKNSAAIGSLFAAKVYKVKVVARGIEDSAHNFTRFFVIGNTEPKATPSDKTSIMFSIKDKVGALHDMLVPFKTNKVNLTKIESRPSKKRVWDYYFFIDLEGHKDTPKVKKAILELENKCRFLKILGSYPVSE
jgi:chorismate mutase/prephenate dehydratase